MVTRLICTLALIVAAVPIRAGAMPCAEPAKPVAVAKAACDMPCCGPEKAVARADSAMPCCPEGHSVSASASAPRGMAKASNPCGCEIKSFPGTPAKDEAVQAVPIQTLAAVLPAPAFAGAILTALAEPGIFGIDSGPPSGGAFAPDRGRAPPRA